MLDFNPEFSLALKLMEKGSAHLFVTGKAGVGKSTLLSHFRDNSPDGVAVVAPTGVAALNVRGQTIHRFFGFGVNTTPMGIATSGYRPRNPQLYKSLRTLVIDEASMLRADLLDCIDAFLRRYGPHPRQDFGGARMVFVGDLHQLAPIVTPDDRDAIKSAYPSPHFFSANAIRRTGLEVIELRHVYRQKDDEFIGLLNRVREDAVRPEDIRRLNERVDPSYAPGPDEFCVTLTTTNALASAINKRKLASLSGQLWVSPASVKGDFGKNSFPTEEELHFKEGAQIMMVNNDPRGRWVNGTVGRILKVDKLQKGESSVRVLLRDSERAVDVTRHKWDSYRFAFREGAIVSEPSGSFEQLPFRLAWAVTIHKAQGKTFDRVVVDLGRGAFTTGQTYVALSRCTSLEGIVLRRRIEPDSILCDRRVLRFLADNPSREERQYSFPEGGRSLEAMWS